MNISTEGAAGDELRALREQLAAAGFTIEHVRELLKVSEPAETIIGSTGRYSLIMMDKLAASSAPAAVLAQLFLFSGRVANARLALLPAPLVELLRRRGFVEAVPDADDRVRATVAMTEYRGSLFLSDTLFENTGDNFVVHGDIGGRCFPLHASSLETWRNLAPPASARSFLDAGCGSGCQSILGASRYQRIRGFDLNPRAVEFARANAFMNRVDASYVVGDFGTYRDDATYDHIALNSPHADGAFPLINHCLDALLAAGGTAQIWSPFEVNASAGTLRDTLRMRIPAFDKWSIEIALLPDSPMGLPRAAMGARSMPRGSLAVDHPAKWKARVEDLRARGVLEIAVAVLTIRRA